VAEGVYCARPVEVKALPGGSAAVVEAARARAARVEGRSDRLPRALHALPHGAVARRRGSEGGPQLNA